jgi:hypothetical protein
MSLWKSASIHSQRTRDPLNVVTDPASASKLLGNELADQVSSFYGLGGHHRPDFVASAPVTILAQPPRQDHLLSTAVRAQLR